MTITGRVNRRGDPIPPWGCGRLAGFYDNGDPYPCEWSQLCEECEEIPRPGFWAKVWEELRYLWLDYVRRDK